MFSVITAFFDDAFTDDVQSNTSSKRRIDFDDFEASNSSQPNCCLQVSENPLSTFCPDVTVPRNQSYHPDTLSENDGAVSKERLTKWINFNVDVLDGSESGDFVEQN